MHVSVFTHVLLQFKFHHSTEVQLTDSLIINKINKKQLCCFLFLYNNVEQWLNAQNGWIWYVWIASFFKDAYMWIWLVHFLNRLMYNVVIHIFIISFVSPLNNRKFKFYFPRIYLWWWTKQHKRIIIWAYIPKWFLPVGAAVSSQCVFHHRCSVKFYHRGLISCRPGGQLLLPLQASGVLTETLLSTC